jgi:hypothetical protein
LDCEVDEMSTEDHPDWWRPVGGQNSQDSTLERRSLVWNDNDVVAPAAPPAFYTGEVFKGKFFTRGCRGMMEQLQIYCRRTAAGTLTLRYSPHPCLGPVGTVVVVPGAAWAWVPVPIEEMWDYDSLFVWVYECSPDVSWAFDAVLPYDGHESLDLGATWADLDIRPFIRAVYAGETPGDVPVSGIVNTVKIPSTGSQVSFHLYVDVPDGVITLIDEYDGAGVLLQATIRVEDDNLVVPTNPYAGVIYAIRVEADGLPAFFVDNRDLTQSSVATTGRSSCGEFLLELAPASGMNWLIMNLRVPLEFRNHLALFFYHRAGNLLSTSGWLFANVLR